MNFYPRFPGDYAKKTARLSLAEHGAYTLLLDEVYSTEEALPADADELCRICRALTKEERAAVIKVAEKFFPVGSDGLRHNERAEEEIAQARPKIDAAKANGKKGGRPKKITQQKPTGFPEENPSGSPGQNPGETQSQSSPHPHPEPDSSLRSENTHRDFSTDGGRVGSPAGEVCMAMKAQGVFDVAPDNLELRTLLQAGAEVHEFIAAAQTAVSKRKGFAYALGIVRRSREEAASAKPLHQGVMPHCQPAQRAPTPAELRVYRSSPGIMDPDARARVEAHLGVKPTESPAVATGDFIDMEAPHGNAIGMD